MLYRIPKAALLPIAIALLAGTACQKEDTPSPDGPIATEQGTLKDAVNFVSSGQGPNVPSFRLEGDCFNLSGGGYVTFCTGGTGTFCAGSFQFQRGVNGGYGPYYYIKPQNQTGTYGRCKVRFRSDYANIHVGDYNKLTKHWSFGPGNGVTFEATEVFTHPPACY